MIYGILLISILFATLSLITIYNNNDTIAKSQRPNKCKNCSALCSDYSVKCCSK